MPRPTYLPSDQLQRFDDAQFGAQAQNDVDSLGFAQRAQDAIRNLSFIPKAAADIAALKLPDMAAPPDLNILTTPRPEITPITTPEQMQATYQSGQTGQPVSSDTQASSADDGPLPSSATPPASAPAGSAPLPAGAPPAAVPTNPAAATPQGPPPSGDDPWGQKAYAAAVKAGHPNPAEFVEQMRWESGNFDPNVISGKRASSAGAQGIAQIMPGTAAGWGVNPLDPDAALAAAAQHMAAYYQQYGGDSEKALAAYNMGEGNLQKYGPRGLPETNKYIDIIHQRTGARAGQAPSSDRQVAAPSSRAPQSAPVAAQPSSSPISYDDMVTVRMPDGKGTMQVPRGMVGEGPGQYAPSKGWTVVGDPAPVAQAPQAQGGPPWEPSTDSSTAASTSGLPVASASQTASMTPPMGSTSPSPDLMLRQPLSMPTSGPDTVPTVPLTAPETTETPPVVPQSATGFTAAPTWQDSQTEPAQTQPSAPTDAPGPVTPGASAPAPAPASPGAGAFQDDYTDAGSHTLDVPDTSGPVVGPTQPQPSILQRIQDAGGAAKAGLTPILDAAGKVKAWVEGDVQAASDAASAAVPQIGPALNAAGLPDVATPVIKTARGVMQGVSDSMAPDGTYLDQASDLGTWIGNGIRAATGFAPVETPKPTGVVEQAMDAARRAGYALVSGTMQANVASDIWKEFGLPTTEIGGMEINPGVFLVPGRFAGGGMEAASGPAAGRIAGALENVGDRAATAVRGAAGAAVDTVRGLIHAPDPAGAPNAGLWFSKPDASPFTPEEVQQVQGSLASRGIQAHLGSDGSTIVIPAHDAPPGFVNHVTDAVKEAGYGPEALTSYAGETRPEMVGDRPAGAAAGGDQPGAALGPTVSERGAGGIGSAAADSSQAGDYGRGDRQLAQEADQNRYGGPSAAPPDQGNGSAAVQRGPESAAVGPQRAMANAVEAAPDLAAHLDDLQKQAAQLRSDMAGPQGDRWAKYGQQRLPELQQQIADLQAQGVTARPPEALPKPPPQPMGPALTGASAAVPARALIGAATGGAAGAITGDQTSDPNATTGERVARSLVFAGAGAAGGATTAIAGTVAAGHLLDSLIERGAVNPRILATHPELPDRIRALFALAAHGLPDDAVVPVPSMASALASLKPSAAAQVGGLLDGPVTAGQVRQIAGDATNPGVAQTVKEMVADAMAGLNTRGQRARETSADAATVAGIPQSWKDAAVPRVGESASALDTGYGPATRVDPEGSPNLINFVNETADNLGVDRPGVYVAPSSAVNASATADDGKPALVLTRGLLRSGLTDDEMAAVLTHELAHTAQPQETGVVGRAMGAVNDGFANLTGAGSRETANALPGGGQPPANLPPPVQQAVQQAQAQQAPGLHPLEWTRRFLGEVGYSSMIGPATGAVNLVGDLSEPLYGAPKEALRGAVRAVQTGNASALREPGEMAKAGAAQVFTLQGLAQTGSQMVDALMARGRYAATPGHEPLSQLTNNPIGKAITTGLEMGGRVFSSIPDAFFGSIAEHAGEARAAAQVATDAGHTGAQWKQTMTSLLNDAQQVKAGTLMNPSPEVIQVIKDGQAYAKRQTFQDPLGEIGKRVKIGAQLQFLPDGKGGNKSIPVLGSMLTPFFNTPWNMALRMNERTPIVGALMNTQHGFDKHYDQVVGSALLLGMGALATNGTITGAGPNDPQKKSEMRSQGWRPYSTLINGVYVPNRVMGVFGPLMNGAGDVHDAIAYAKDSSPGSITSDFLGRLGQQIQQQPYLQGLSNIIQAFNAGQGGGLGSGVERYVSSNLTRMVPYAATARVIGTSEDPLERTTDQGKNVPAAQTVAEQVRSGIGNRQGFESLGQQPLPASQNVLGQPQVNQQAGAASLFAKTSLDHPDPTVKAFMDAGVDIGFPKSTLTIDTIPVALTPEETRQWQTYRGDVLQRFGAGMTQRAFWANPAARQAGMKNLLDQANQAADQRLMQSMGPAEIRRRVLEARQQQRQAVAP